MDDDIKEPTLRTEEIEDSTLLLMSHQNLKAWDIDGQLKHTDLLDKLQNLKLRKICAFSTLIGVGLWLIFVGETILLQGFSLLSFHLSDTVLITLLSTTTANVIGGLWIIYRYLFNDKGKNSD